MLRMPPNPVHGGVSTMSMPEHAFAPHDHPSHHIDPATGKPMQQQVAPNHAQQPQQQVAPKPISDLNKEEQKIASIYVLLNEWLMFPLAGDWVYSKAIYPQIILNLMEFRRFRMPLFAAGY